MRTIGTGAIIALALVVAVPAAQAQVALGAIEGDVVDAKTGAPVGFANVVVARTTWMTNAKDPARWRFPSIPVGTYEVFANFVGYEKQTIRDVVVTAGGTTTLHFALVRGYGVPLSSVRVSSRARCIRIRDVGTRATVHRVESAPAEISQLTCAPNPFNPVTTIRYTLGRAGPVDVRIFDVRGRVVRGLFQGVQERGVQTLLWDGRATDGAQAASGIYFARVKTADAKRALRLVLVE